MRVDLLLPAAVALLAFAPAGGRAGEATDAAALEALLSGSNPGQGFVIEQTVTLERCAATVVQTVTAESGEPRLEERSRLQIRHYEPADVPDSTALDLTARRYFTRAADRGLARWLDDLAASRDDPDRSARMYEIQRRVEAGDYGAFAQANGYESRSFLEGDPEPYYAMPLPALSLLVPDGTAGTARRAWTEYAMRHCLGTAEP